MLRITSDYLSSVSSIEEWEELGDYFSQHFGDVLGRRHHLDGWIVTSRFLVLVY